MNNLTIFFGGAFAGAGVTFLAMCFAICISRAERQTAETEDNKGAADE